LWRWQLQRKRMARKAKREAAQARIDNVPHTPQTPVLSSCAGRFGDAIAAPSRIAIAHRPQRTAV
jgi:hypothetical protein